MEHPDKILETPIALEGVPALIASVSSPDFGDQILQFVQSAAKIDNVGAFHSPDLKRLEAKLSLWSGAFGDYWFRYSGALITNAPKAQDHILHGIRAAPENGVLLGRWHPTGDDPRVPIYKRMKVIERIAISSRFGRGGYQSFYLRSSADGWITDAEMAALEQVLPVAHQLIALRHRIIGSEAYHFRPNQQVSALRDRGLGPFAALSPREAEVCDCLINAMTALGTAAALGIAESSVRTLRRRAYRKLNVSSGTEVMALMMHEQGGA
ncbi:MAG: LuxR C-terminal-related transcriptional regulator [Pelagimonas sp.]|jgi:DNA-binding CsgD family transcriptional regulator|nr:LuxR C-terminal-related transcriptional regulator [Pelagimonas sp.]